uniref:Uncharacterized protein n=1 Tax=Siphoviridae sp. ctzjp2 TaxID=2826532 RepID=A0A8S5QNR0_9CAUD|nr:MAG TPA: hypothetical protein [Siphoviridae sp. ctzjp2]DAS65183.1 MAG TPA: hypothetical protein [Caudoviricetes sp.]DAY31928.1 MAG TPA: hypothetical protein [Caudoviricetes sp.]
MYFMRISVDKAFCHVYNISIESEVSKNANDT